MGKPQNWDNPAKFWNLPAEYYSVKIKRRASTKDAEDIRLIFTDTQKIEDDKVYAKDQMTWFQNQLEEANENEAMKIWMGHHPIYSNGNGDAGMNGNNEPRGQLNEVFEKARGNMYICGHEHNTQALRKRLDTSIEHFVDHFVTGGGGHNLRTETNKHKSKAKKVILEERHGSAIHTVDLIERQVTTRMRMWDDSKWYTDEENIVINTF